MRALDTPLIPLLAGAGDEPGTPVYLQLYRRLREAILAGMLPPGSRLPASRVLARDLELSRNTVEAAVGQLQAEGFLVRRVGAGTFVTPSLPGRPLRPARFRAADRVPPAPRSRGATGPGALSERGRRTVATEAVSDGTVGLLFGPCVPGVASIPLDAWNGLAARRARRTGADSLLPGDPAGHLPLRRAIAAHIGTTRGVRCGPEQVLVLVSTQQALSVAAQLLLDPGDPVWVEEPGYPAARAAFRAAGAEVVPVPVDAEGLDVEEGVRRAPGARLAYVTPSHQYPLGATLSLRRRVALLEWAERAGSWIFEDDYDSEIRYVGRPLASIQGIDTAGRVIYAGTFNKVLFPSLRLAYLVLPADLVEPFARARATLDGFPPRFPQEVLAEFIAHGHLAQHLRRVRELYRERRDVFVAAAREHLGDALRLGPADAGMHTVGWLPPGLDDRAVSLAARGRGLGLPALSLYYAAEAPAPGLLFHFANAPADAIPGAVRTFAEVLREHL